MKNFGKEDYYSCVEILSLPLNPASLPFVSSFSKRGVRYCYEILVLEKRARLRLWIYAKLRLKKAEEIMKSLTSKVLEALKVSNPQMKIVEKNPVNLEVFYGEKVLNSLVKVEGFPRALNGGSKEYFFAYLSTKALPVKPFEDFVDRLIDVCVGLPDADFSICFVFCEKRCKNYKPHAHHWGRGKHVLEDRKKAEWKEDLSSKHYEKRRDGSRGYKRTIVGVSILPRQLSTFGPRKR